MPAENEIRKLAAIMHADVRGYSRLMGENESYTVHTLNECRKIFSDNIDKYRGRVVNAPGDSILSEFPSVVSAVQCAVRIQEQLKARNADLPDDRKMEFRIGVNLGDVIESGDAIYGDGVNIAARIEALTVPGGISISKTVFDHIQGKLEYGYEYQGEHQVKNISKPVKVYKLLTAPEDAGRLFDAPKPQLFPTKEAFLATVAALFILATFVLLLWNPSISEIEPASEDNMAFPLPKKPSIVVLPFDNLSGDVNQEYIADGITENIITSLAQIPQLFVIARNSSFTYKGKSVAIRDVGEELGVQYVLEGSVQRSGNRLRINAQLINAMTGSHLWAERYDKQLDDIFDLQDEITTRIVSSLNINITRHGGGYETDNFEAWSEYIKGLRLHDRLTKGSTEKARSHFEKAAEIDPNYVHAWIQQAWTHWLDARLGWSDSPNESIEISTSLAKNASEIDNTKASLHSLWNQLYMLRGDYEKAISEGEKAVELEPNGSRHHIFLAAAYNYNGNPKNAIEHAKQAMRLEPYYPPWFMFYLAGPYEMLGRYEDAIEINQDILDRAKKGEIPPILAHERLTIAYMKLGEKKKAEIHAQAILQINPKYSVDDFRKTTPYKDEAYLNELIRMLVEAGLPEYPPGKEPEKPSIAVLPFDNMSNDPEQEYFSDGISEDLITDLSKISDLLVISRMSTFTYKGKSVKVQQIAEELGVKYILEGSVRKAANQVRINAQLIDAASGHHIWADRYDGDMSDIFALQDNITRKIISAMALKLTASEQKAIIDKGTHNLEAYDEFLKGWQGYRLLTAAGFSEAKMRLEKAVELDPEFTRAYAALAALYWKATQLASPELRKGLGITNRQEFLAVKAKPHQLLDKAMKKPTALAHGLMSQLYLLRYQHDEAFAEIERAVSMDPNDPELYAWMSEVLWLVGKNSEAVEAAKKGLRLDPSNPATYLRVLGKTYLPDGNLNEGLQVLERLSRLNPELSGSVGLLRSIIYSLQGRGVEAQKAYDIFLKNRMTPVRNLNDILLYFPLTDQKKLERIAEALIIAGAPGEPTDYYKIFKENRINGNSVKSLLFGHKIAGTAMSTGRQLWWEWDKNGEFKWDIQVFKDTGRSWIEEDVLHIQFKKFLGGLPYGTVIYRNPDGSRKDQNQYFMVSDVGSITIFALAE